jgi:hypothetical protein
MDGVVTMGTPPRKLIDTAIPAELDIGHVKASD